MYWQDKYILKDSIEYEIKYAGRYGAKGEKRQKKKKATPETIKKQNQRNRETKMRRTIEVNFEKDDLWLCLKYPKGTRKSIKEFEKDIRNFHVTMRRRYKTHGSEYKFVERHEIGSRGGLHMHILIPKIPKADAARIASEVWKHGSVHFEFYDGNSEGIAVYMVKEPTEEVEKQLKLFDMEDRGKLVRYSTSRNLIRPKPERKKFKYRTVKKMIRQGIKPSKGYYIIKDSVKIGINQYTGMSFIHYTERKVKDG